MAKSLYLLMGVSLLFVFGCGTGKPRDKPRARGEDFGLIDATDEVGLDFVHDAGAIGTYPMPQIMGSGAALFDFDADGDLDIFLVNGGPLAEAGNDAARPVLSRLFRQEADGTFGDVTEQSRLANPGYGMGTAVGDIDNDGDLDLYVTNYGPDRLFRNNGDGTFTDVTESAGISNPKWGTAACFFDYDRDGWLDLFVVNYLDFFPGSICEDGSGRRDYCGPESFPGTVDKLYRNVGSGGAGPTDARFAEVTVAAGIAARAGRGLGLVCRDFNHDGRADIYVANDMEANFLWMQQQDGTFRDEALLRGVALNQLGEPEASMGVAVGDLVGDREPDLFLTHLRGETNTVYAADSSGQFEDKTSSSGLGPPSLHSTGFGVAAVDLELDGDLDLVIANGRVKRAPPIAADDVDENHGPDRSQNSSPHWKDYAEPNQVFLNEKGSFAADPRLGDIPFARRIDVSRGLASGDVDNDGDLDLLVTNCGGRARLYRNEYPREGSWLVIRAVNPAANRDSYGARVTVKVGDRVWQREVNPSTSYLSSNDPRVHFGLGNAERYDSITIQWPDKAMASETFPGGETNRFLTVARGTGQVIAEAPAK